MNREILFRGKSIDNRFSGWFEGFYLEMELCDGDGRCSYIKMDGYSPIKVDPETVGQFTGIKDKNGTDIFEGDIIRITMPLYHSNPIIKQRAVLYYKDGFGLVWSSDRGAYLKDLEKCVTDSRLGSFTPDVTFEVIGNIYDTPSLLK